ncbi:hypothetical protein N7493_008818 [Penicillium malachiteum]|uniref:Uncharacterized protein n=1 Tax=Penicillium malachiteum TaxID=1324776 RepID=A0AAD6HFA6_9EURO|nr:hypothetical protein N7493_008818 [Penicillium malachiteum]
MSSKGLKYILGTNRGPLLTPGDASENQGLEKAGGLSLVKTPTRTQRVRRHWKRFWCVYCLGNVIFLAIFLPILFLVIIPAIAQLVVNKSDLYLINAVVDHPKPDSILLTLQTEVDLHLLIPVRIDDLPLSLFEREYGVNDPYVQFTIPGQKIKGNHTMGISDNFTTLDNMTAWDLFLHQVVFEEETTLAVAGSTNAYIGVLKSHVHLNKNIKTPGLNKFNGFSISDATVVLPAESDGTNLIGNTTLPNPTVMTLEVGTLTLDVKAGNLTIGNVTVEDVTLVPGDNVFPMKGTLDFTTIIKNLAAVIKSEATAIKAGNLSINAITTSVVWNGTEVPYYTDILSQLTLSANIGIGDILKNTLAYLKSEGNITSTLSNLTSDLNLSSLETRSTNTLRERAPVDLSPFMKHNQHIQDIIREIEPDDRDFIVKSLGSLYPDA